MWNLVTLSPPAARKTSKYVHLNGHVIKKNLVYSKKKKKIWYILLIKEIIHINYQLIRVSRVAQR